jgi:hypothetical protein
VLPIIILLHQTVGSAVPQFYNRPFSGPTSDPHSSTVLDVSQTQGNYSDFLSLIMGSDPSK